MRDLNEILDGTVEAITTVLKELTAEQLADLRVMEESGQGRSGVDKAIGRALAALSAAAGGTDDVIETIEPVTPADGPQIPPVETPAFEPLHPAVDGDLRAGTTEVMNRIDFNDPLTGGRQIVEAALASSAED
ncbi:hypothetical protein [Sphingomonas sp. Leaf62]|uniref:hypothetical protein n=1 Tax=Sphingomonas sp. Leaf62 TaxID=1736228 RepID=UPI0006F301DC|nr:hypothetical protein [Sphingomonas sp. Leaf62]KQN77872.1 hypothetical protein ASE91_14235 [Sphingomonas sp. Leaf62]